MKKAIIPGSFDPIHEGHIGIIKKASKLFDHVYVAVTFNNEKDKTIPLEERAKEVQLKIEPLKNVSVIINKNTTTGQFAKELGVKYLVRSARNETDFRYELELAAGNNFFNNELETVLIVPDYSKIDYSSTLIRQKVGE